MNVSAINSNDINSRKNLFIRYANHFMSFKANQDDESQAAPVPVTNPDQKINKVKGIETLTIFPKQVIEGRTVITA